MKLIIDIPDDKYTDIKNGYMCQEYADEIINLIPIAEVYNEHKISHWIPLDYIGVGMYECANCHAVDEHDNDVNVPYCWRCGCRMVDNGDKKNEDRN